MLGIKLGQKCTRKVPAHLLYYFFSASKNENLCITSSILLIIKSDEFYSAFHMCLLTTFLGADGPYLRYYN